LCRSWAAANSPGSSPRPPSAPRGPRWSSASGSTSRSPGRSCRWTPPPRSPCPAPCAPTATPCCARSCAPSPSTTPAGSSTTATPNAVDWPRSTGPAAPPSASGCGCTCPRTACWRARPPGSTRAGSCGCAPRTAGSTPSARATSSTSGPPPREFPLLRPDRPQRSGRMFLDGGAPEGLNRQSRAPHHCGGVPTDPCPAGATPTAPTSNTREPMSSRPDPKETEAVLMGGEARYTRDEVVRLTGTSPEIVARVWRALGFATRGDDAPAYTDSDVEAMRVTARLIREGTLTEEAAVRLARAMGQTMIRLAVWQTNISTTLSYTPELDTDDHLVPLAELAQELLPDMETLLLHVWRRQLAAAVSRSLAVQEQQSEDASPHYFPLIVGFADLVSFTTLSRELDEVGLADVVEGFEATSADIVASGGGRIVKTLGDEILYVADD